MPPETTLILGISGATLSLIVIKWFMARSDREEKTQADVTQQLITQILRSNQTLTAAVEGWAKAERDGAAKRDEILENQKRILEILKDGNP